MAPNKLFFFNRPNASTLFGFGTVNGVNGLIILPDNWTLPVDATFNPSTGKGLESIGDSYNNNSANNYSHNSYSEQQWKTMEEAGAVFLPAAGVREGDAISSAGEDGSYWTLNESFLDYNKACALNFTKEKLVPRADYDRFHGRSVRLVQDFDDEAPGSSLAVDHTASEETKVASRKILRHGQLIIDRNGKTFNALGIEVR